MTIMYKGDQSCKCNRDQESTFLGAGWSYKKDEVAEKATPKEVKKPATKSKIKKAE